MGIIIYVHKTVLVCIRPVPSTSLFFYRRPNFCYVNKPFGPEIVLAYPSPFQVQTLHRHLVKTPVSWFDFLAIIMQSHIPELLL